MTLIMFFKETVGPDQKRDKIVQLRSFLAPDPSFLALLFNKKNWAIMSLSALQR